MLETLQAYLEKARELWGGLDRNRKIAVAGIAGGVLVLLLFLSFGGGKGEVHYLPLYTDIDLKEAGEIATHLKEMNQDFKISGGGSMILVPEKDRPALRAALAAEGYPKTGYVGYEIFDEMPLGMTDFLQKVDMRRALEGELKKTIMHLDQVQDVQLHVVIPEPSLFTEKQKPATASIMLKLRPRMKLDPAQIEGIQRLVAGSVEGLDYKNITVVDSEGNLLSQEVNPLARLTSKQLDVERNVEQYLEKRAQDMLNHVLGPDQALVRVSAQLDFDKVDETVTSYDPASTVLRSEERTDENSAEAGTKEHTISNWEINQTVRHIAGASGTVQRLSASLTINQRVPNGVVDGKTQYRNRTPDEITQVTNLVRGAIGFDAKRGDQLTISTFPFAVVDLRAQAEARQQAEQRQQLITSVVLNVAKGIAIVIALLVLRAIIGAIGRGVAREEEIAMEAQRELAEEEVAEELPETPHELLLGRIAQLISERPEDAAKLIRTMLIEDAQQRQPTS